MRSIYRSKADKSAYDALALEDFIATDTLGVGGFGRVELVRGN